MAEISGLGGLSSVETYINTFLSVERRPLEDLKSKKSDLQRLSAVYTDLKSELSNLLSRVQGFNTFGIDRLLGSKLALSSNEAIITAEATSRAGLGIHSIFVSRIASRDIAISDRISRKQNSLASKFYKTTQQFTLKIGDNKAVSISVSFNDKKETNSDVLNRIANSINDSLTGITANVIQVDRNSVRLSIISDDTGSENEITLREGKDSSLLSEIGFVSADGERTVATKNRGGFLKSNVDDLDALFTLNGVEITQGTNKIENIIKGLTINLLKAHKQDDQPETITVSADNDQIKEEIKGFIEDYNQALTFINNKTSVGVDSRDRGALTGNFGIQRLRIKLREIVSSTVEGDDNTTIKRLSQIGIEINRDGTLKIEDEDKFDSQIAENPDDVQALFNGEFGIGNKLETELKRFTRVGGVIGDVDRGIRLRIRNIEKRTKRFNERLRGRESNLRQQFSRLQKILTSLSAQQRILQLTNIRIPGFNFGISRPRTSGFFL